MDAELRELCERLRVEVAHYTERAVGHRGGRFLRRHGQRLLDTIAAQAAELGEWKHAASVAQAKVVELQGRRLALEAELEGVRKSATEVYAAIPNLPVTPETCEAATDAFVLFCNAFNDHIADTAIADSGAGGGA